MQRSVGTSVALRSVLALVLLQSGGASTCLLDGDCANAYATPGECLAGRCCDPAANAMRRNGCIECGDTGLCTRCQRNYAMTRGLGCVPCPAGKGTSRTVSADDIGSDANTCAESKMPTPSPQSPPLKRQHQVQLCRSPSCGSGDYNFCAAQGSACLVSRAFWNSARANRGSLPHDGVEWWVADSNKPVRTGPAQCASSPASANGTTIWKSNGTPIWESCECMMKSV